MNKKVIIYTIYNKESSELLAQFDDIKDVADYLQTEVRRIKERRRYKLFLENKTEVEVIKDSFNFNEIYDI